MMYSFKLIRLLPCLLTALAVSDTSHAQDNEGKDLTLKDNLERIVAAGQGQELALRMIKFGLNVNPIQIDRDRQARFVCSHSPPAGSHLNHLSCNENEILLYLDDAGVMGSDPETGPAADIFPFQLRSSNFISRHPVAPTVLETAMASLGPEVFNRKLVLAVFQGKPLPDNAPGLKELDQFATALAAVSAIQSDYDDRMADATSEERKTLLAESDQVMAQAIADAGLTIERYNQISMMVEQYPALRGYVREQM